MLMNKILKISQFFKIKMNKIILYKTKFNALENFLLALLILKMHSRHLYMVARFYLKNKLKNIFLKFAKAHVNIFLIVAKEYITIFFLFFSKFYSLKKVYFETGFA